MRALGLLGAMLPAKDIYLAASSLFDTIITRISENTPLAVMEEMQEDLFRGEFLAKCGEEPFNTYPLDDSEDSEAYHNSFLGLCVGMGRLSDVLENMKLWSNRVDMPERLQEEKCAVLLTDKWDTAEFTPYEQPFRYLAMNRNFWFVVIFVKYFSYFHLP